MPRVGSLQIFPNHAGIVELVQSVSQFGLGRAFEGVVTASHALERNDVCECEN